MKTKTNILPLLLVLAVCSSPAFSFLNAPPTEVMAMTADWEIAKYNGWRKTRIREGKTTDGELTPSMLRMRRQRGPQLLAAPKGSLTEEEKRLLLDHGRQRGIFQIVGGPSRMSLPWPCPGPADRTTHLQDQ